MYGIGVKKGKVAPVQLTSKEEKYMQKQVVKLESLMTVISPAQIVQILNESLAAGATTDLDEITEFKGTAAKAFREYEGKGATVKHISPEMGKESGKQSTGRYVMQIYIYQGVES